MATRLPHTRAVADSSARADLEHLARRMSRIEVVTRAACAVAGLLLSVGAVVFFIHVVRIGPRAATGAILGAIAIAIPAVVLLQRGLAGRDPDTDFLKALTFRRWT